MVWFGTQHENIALVNSRGWNALCHLVELQVRIRSQNQTTYPTFLNKD